MARRKQVRRVNGATGWGIFRLEQPEVMFLKWLRAFLPFAIILLADPFGCSQVADRYSQQIVLRVMAPLHSGPYQRGRYASTEGQKRVAVVLLDQQWLDQLSKDSGKRETWPPPRSVQIQQVLGTILAQKPNAVLLDYTFNADQLAPSASGGEEGDIDPESPQFIRALLETQRLATSGERGQRGGPIARPRIFLGSKPVFQHVTATCPVQKISWSELARADDVATTLRTWSPEAGKSEVELVTLRSFSESLYAPLPFEVREEVAGGCEPVESEREYLASPAYALFFAYCEREGARQNRLCAGQHRRPLGAVIPDDKLNAIGVKSGALPSYYLYSGDHPALKGNLAPDWPAFRSEKQMDIDSELVAAKVVGRQQQIDACEVDAKGPLRPSAVLIWDLFWSKLWQSDRKGTLDVEPCRYGIDVYRMDVLKKFANNDPPPLEGRYVLVGLDLASNPDYAESPLFRQVPGVMIHAVALENMISKGDGYISDSSPKLSVSGPVLTLSLGLLITIFATLLDKEKIGDRLNSLLKREGVAAVVSYLLLTVAICSMVLIPLIIGASLTYLFNVAPLNWVSTIAAMTWLPAMVLDARERLVEVEAAQHRTTSSNRFVIWRNPVILLAVGVILVCYWIAGSTTS